VTVTFSTAPPNTVFVILSRSIPLVQQTPYSTSRGYQGKATHDYATVVGYGNTDEDTGVTSNGGLIIGSYNATGSQTIGSASVAAGDPVGSYFLNFGVGQGTFHTRRENVLEWKRLN